MNYEKKYKEALERAKKYKLKEDLIITQDIFPELAESEDERNQRIKKEVVEMLHYYHSKSPCFIPPQFSLEETLVWLEKQGDPQDKGEISDGYHTFNELYYYRMLYNAAFFNMLPKEWVHKSKRHNDGEECFGGGWIVYNDANVYQVKEIDYTGKIPRYELENIDGDKLSIPFTSDYNLRNWIIQDAKEGDVLVYGDNTISIVIFKNFYNNSSFHSYCYIKYEKFFISEDKTLGWRGDGFHPATKEQRELLFAKMADAGYEWDAENKELKKIEPKHTDEVKPKFKVGDLIKEKIDKYGDSIIKIEGIDSENYYYFDKEFPIKISEQDNWELVEQKTADKVEPKFKIGDWLSKQYLSTPFVIVDIKDNLYILIDTEGNKYKECIDFVHERFHLWTIEDAEDGDVICYKDEISLYKHDIKNCTKQETTFGGFVYYCCYDGKRFVIDSLYSLIEQDKMDIHPATKEQRDILFQKMKEAGYEWDADNKELKEIEQNPTERSLPYEKNETAKKLIALAECLEMDGDCLFNGLSGDDYGKLLRVLAIELTEIKPAWSEEDEKIIKEACKIINCYGNIITEQNEANKAYRIADKLKSLKDRI